MVINCSDLYITQLIHMSASGTMKGPGELLFVDPPFPETEYDKTKIPSKPALWRPQVSSGAGFLPPMREYSAGAVCHGKYYMFGGLGAGPSGRFNTLACLDLATLKWSNVKSNTGLPPTPRSKHTLTCYRDKLYVYGGEAGFDGDFCTGDNRSSRDIFNNVFTFDTKKLAWKAVATAGVPPEKVVPSARRGHTAGLYILGIKNRGPCLIVFGGAGPEPVKSRDRLLGDLWSLELDTNKWRPLRQLGDSPSARSNHAMVIIDSDVYIYGGITETGTSSELFCYNILKQSWRKIGIYGHGPGVQLNGLEAGLYGHSMHQHPWRDSSLVLYGGRDTNTQPSQETWILDLAGLHANWRRERSGGALPAGRVGHVSFQIKKYLVVYGGCSVGGYANSELQVYCYSTPPVHENSVMKFADTENMELSHVQDDSRPRSRTMSQADLKNAVDHLHHSHYDSTTGVYKSPGFSYKSFKSLSGQKRTTRLDRAMLPPDPFAPPPPPYRGFKANMSSEQKMQFVRSQSTSALLQGKEELTTANGSRSPTIEKSASQSILPVASTALDGTSTLGEVLSTDSAQIDTNEDAVFVMPEQLFPEVAESGASMEKATIPAVFPELKEEWSEIVWGEPRKGVSQGGTRTWMHDQLGIAYIHPLKKKSRDEANGIQSLPNLFPLPSMSRQGNRSRGSSIFPSPSRLGSPSRLERPATVGSMMDLSYGLSVSVLNNSSNVL